MREILMWLIIGTACASLIFSCVSLYYAGKVQELLRRRAALLAGLGKE